MLSSDAAQKRKFIWEEGDIEFEVEEAIRLNSYLEAKAKVKAHARRSKTGKVVQVKQHEREISKAAEEMKIIGANEKEEAYIRELLSRHDEKILEAVPFVAVMDTKDFAKATKAYGYKKYELPDTLAVYDEVKAHIIIHRNAMTGPKSWKEALDHEVGHAAYYHSEMAASIWRNAYHRTSGFDKFTEYAKTNADEGFAESYMAYIASGGKAKNKKYKDVWAVVKKTVDGANPKDNWRKRRKYPFGG